MIEESFQRVRLGYAGNLKKSLSGFSVLKFGIIGDVDGHVYMSMDAETGKILTSEMLGGMEIADVDEMVISAVGEICNMIMGNACTSMSLLNASVDITLPTVLIYQQMPQLTLNYAYNISVVLDDLDAIDFNVAVK